MSAGAWAIAFVRRLSSTCRIRARSSCDGSGPPRVLELEGDPDSLGGAYVRGAGVLEQGAGSYRLADQVAGRHLPARSQIVDQALQSVDLGEKSPDRRGVGRHDAVTDPLHVPAEHGQRSAQLVRHVVEDLVSLPFRPREIRGEALEGRRQVVQLRDPGRRQRDPPIARRDPRGDLRRGPHRPGDAATDDRGQTDAGDGGDRGPQHRGEGDLVAEVFGLRELPQGEPRRDEPGASLDTLEARDVAVGGLRGQEERHDRDDGDGERRDGDVGQDEARPKAESGAASLAALRGAHEPGTRR